MKRPLVYFAAPYSRPDPCENTHLAIKEAESVLRARPTVVPVVPHLSHFWHTMRPHPYEFWLDLDIELLRRCDVLYRFGGESSGADAEVAFAIAGGIPVCTTLTELCMHLDALYDAVKAEEERREGWVRFTDAEHGLVNVNNGFSVPERTKQVKARKVRLGDVVVLKDGTRVDPVARLTHRQLGGLVALEDGEGYSNTLALDELVTIVKRKKEGK